MTGTTRPYAPADAASPSPEWRPEVGSSRSQLEEYADHRPPSVAPPCVRAVDADRVERDRSGSNGSRRATNGRNGSPNGSAGHQGTRQRSGDDPAPIIPILARRVREVEAKSMEGKVGPAKRTKFQVIALLVREERARIKTDTTITAAARTELLKRLDGVATILAKTAAHDTSLLRLLDGGTPPGAGRPADAARVAARVRCGGHARGDGHRRRAPRRGPRPCPPSSPPSR